MSPGEAQANQAATAMQQNLALRQALLSSAPAMRKNLGNFTGGAPGTTTRIKLFNVGVTTRIVLDVIATVDIGVATATPSVKAPFNIINRVKLTDFDSTDRINASGYQLWQLNCVRKRKYYGYHNSASSAVLSSPSMPTAVGASQQIRFQIEIPVAFDPTSDLRGAMMTQTAVGEAYVNIDWNNVLVGNGNADALYSGGATTTVVQSAGTSFSVNVFQEYLLPQNIGNGVPLPFLDLATVYEFAGAIRTADNIAAGQEKLLNYPNMRTVLGAYFNYLNNGIMNSALTDVAKIRLIANGNNVLREYNAADKLFDQRDYMIESTDTRPGSYWELHRQKPVETALYGNMQIGFTPLTATGANTNLEIGFESFYTKGSTLPGMQQSS